MNINLRSSVFYDNGKKYLEELLQAKNKIDREISNQPDGKIHIIISGGREQYYLRENPKDKGGKYISQKDEASISKYLQKQYNSRAVKILEKEIENIRMFMQKSEYLKLRELFSKYTDKSKKMINPIDMSDAEYLKQWDEKPFLTKGISDDLAYFVTERKEHVRSKSELIIANTLFSMGIPYKYECPLRLSSGRVVYPDFTLPDVKRRCDIYWEHRGMMDERDYAKNAVLKCKEYERDKIFIGDRLFITEETANSPLGTHEIKALISRIYD